MSIFDVCSGFILFLIIIFGIVGNVLSFIVWTKGRRCKKLPGGIYLRALVVSDTTALAIPALNEAINLVTHFNPRTEVDFLCKLEIFGRHYGLLVSSWIIVCFTVERTVAIFRPRRSTGLLSRTGTIALMTIIFVVNFILNFPFGIVYSLIDKPATGTSGDIQNASLTGTNTTGSNVNESVGTGMATTIISSQRVCAADRANFFNYLNWYHIWFMDWFLIFIIPFSLITISNLAVLYLIVSRKTMIQSKLDSKVKGITMRAVIISVMHCVTTGPFSISILFPGYFSRALTVKYSTEYYINRVCFILAFLNHAINFLLYSFFGSEFRRDFQDLWKRHTAVHPTGTSTLNPTGNTGDDGSFTGMSNTRNDDSSKTGKTNISTA